MKETDVGALLKKAQDSLSIQSVRLVCSNLQRNSNLHPAKFKDFKGEVYGYNNPSLVKRAIVSDSNDNESIMYAFEYSVGAKIEENKPDDDTSDEISPAVEIRAVFEAEYLSQSVLDEEVVNAFLERNVQYHVWPYWREYAHNTLNRMELPPSLISVPFYLTNSGAVETSDTETS